MAPTSARSPRGGRCPPAAPLKGHRFQPGPLQRPPRLRSQAATPAGGRPPQKDRNPRGLRGQFRNWAVPGHWRGNEEGGRRQSVSPVPQTSHVQRAPRGPIPYPPKSPEPLPPFGGCRSTPPALRTTHYPRPSRNSSSAPGTREEQAPTGEDREHVPAPPPGPALTVARRAARPARAPGAG